MPNLLATLLMFGTFLIVAALVGYRLVWAASSLAGVGMLVRRLQRWRQWLHGETPAKKII